MFKSLLASFRQDRVRLAAVLSTLALTAFFLAQGTSLLVAASIFGPPSDAAGAAPPTRAAFFPMPSTNKNASAILRRNIFDSSTGPLDVAAAAPVAVNPASFDPNAPAPACTGGMRLVAALVNYSNPALSLAAIVGGGKTLPYRVGMSVEGHQLVSVSPKSVKLSGSTGPCSLFLFNSGNAPPPPPAAPAASTLPAPGGAPTGGISDGEYTAGIQKISDTKYVISRGLLNKILGNRAELMRAALVRPHEENGRVVGVRLFGIRQESLLGRVGMSNGDMLRTINGFDMSSPDSALEAYAKLRSAERLTVSMDRRGTPVTLEYEIR